MDERVVVLARLLAMALDESQRIGAGATNLGHPATERFPHFELPAKAGAVKKNGLMLDQDSRRTGIKKIYHADEPENEIAYPSLIWDFQAVFKIHTR